MAPLERIELPTYGFEDRYPLHRASAAYRLSIGGRRTTRTPTQSRHFVFETNSPPRGFTFRKPPPTPPS